MTWVKLGLLWCLAWLVLYTYILLLSLRYVLCKFGCCLLNVSHQSQRSKHREPGVFEERGAELHDYWWPLTRPASYCQCYRNHPQVQSWRGQSAICVFSHCIFMCCWLRRGQYRPIHARTAQPCGSVLSTVLPTAAVNNIYYMSRLGWPAHIQYTYTQKMNKIMKKSVYMYIYVHDQVQRSKHPAVVYRVLYLTPYSPTDIPPFTLSGEYYSIFTTYITPYSPLIFTTFIHHWFTMVTDQVCR